MLKIKVFISKKSGNRCVALIAKTELAEYMLTFDVGAICDIADKTPSQLAKLDVGEYDIKERSV